MLRPCLRCEKADGRSDYFECDSPCDHARQCFEDDRDFFEVLAGLVPKVLKDVKKNE